MSRATARVCFWICILAGAACFIVGVILTGAWQPVIHWMTVVTGVRT
jgi:hypothetical protein